MPPENMSWQYVVYEALGKLVTIVTILVPVIMLWMRLKAQIEDNTKKTEQAATASTVAAAVTVNSAITTHQALGTDGEIMMKLEAAKAKIDQLVSEDKDTPA